MKNLIEVYRNMAFEGNYKIMIQDDNGDYAICVRRVEQDRYIARFDCIYAAEQYAKRVGLKSGYIIKK